MEFKSKLEAKLWKQLGRKKKLVKYESEKVKYTTEPKLKNYIPDWVVTLPSGYKFYVEIKGYFRPEDRTKMRLVKKCNPDLDIRFFFPYDNKLNKNSGMRYSDWCNKHGFTYAVGTMPKEWFNDNKGLF